MNQSSVDMNDILERVTIKAKANRMKSDTAGICLTRNESERLFIWMKKSFMENSSRKELNDHTNGLSLR